MMACQRPFSYLDLPFSHDLVHNLVVVLVEHAFVVALLVAQDPQVLGALQLNLKLLLNDTDTEEENQIFAIAQRQIWSSKIRCVGD